MENRQQKLDKQTPNELSQFGKPLAEYGRSLGVLVSNTIFLALGLFLVISFVMIIVTGEIKDMGFGEIAIFLVISIGTLWIGISGVRKFIADRGTRILVFTDGLAEVNDTQTKIFKWDEIKTVTVSYTKDESVQAWLIKPLFSIWSWVSGVAFVENSPTFTIELNNGGNQTFTQETKDHKILGNTITKEVTNRLLPKAIEILSNNQTISFGEFRVNQQGIAENNKNISWSEVKGITVSGNTASLDGTTKTIPDTTPNYNVLLGLVEYAIKNNKK